MTAYAIGHITIKDPAKWAEYRSRVADTLAPWGGELLLRGTDAVVLSGDFRRTDTVVIRFPNRQAVTGWHDSPAYQALVPLRQEAADVDLVSYQAD
ncbi:MAG: DUF1330 domain-containing protein [Marinobacter sp.]|uniref:DUF1330 domain-containing protein n=1 Tax=Marinobacter sp. TaxID=50741 RepID=UPI00299EABC3|nr:DUF1330 domain-containing protein [Marinobacter sp.]MDX1633759.1 DUF1330 domain-containing protein [Marinobacter sp.]